MEHSRRSARWPWAAGAVLGSCRLLAYVLLAAPPLDAQWQLGFIPLWLVDLPWSLIYFWVLPFPIGELILGPIWWAALPYLLWRWWSRRAAR